MCVTDPTSCARKLCATFHPAPTMRTNPSWDPRKRFSDPEVTQVVSLPSRTWRVSSSAGVTGVTSKKSKDFHCGRGEVSYGGLERWRRKEGEEGKGSTD